MLIIATHRNYQKIRVFAWATLFVPVHLTRNYWPRRNIDPRNQATRGQMPVAFQNLESPDCGVWRPVDLLPVDWTQVSTFFPAFPAGTGSKKTKEESPVIEVIKWIEGALCRLSREHATRWLFIYQSPYYQCITLPATWFNHLEANITYPCSRREEHSFSESPSLEAYSS